MDCSVRCCLWSAGQGGWKCLRTTLAVIKIVELKDESIGRNSCQTTVDRKNEES